MRKFCAKGGYGEHGRSCFLVEYGKEGHYYMVDCGIMDSDSSPYPDVTEEELEKTDYLFLTHCHKDHSGAFEELRKRGFSGVLAASELTISLSDISYSKQTILPVDLEESVWKMEFSGISLTYGRTGHCPGGLWFYLEDEMGAVFFSGDYQENALVYVCDKVRECKAAMAVVDCAHADTDADPEELRRQIKAALNENLLVGRKVILPLPYYGRGMEMLWFLAKNFAEYRIAADSAFLRAGERILQDKIWYRQEIWDDLLKLFEQIKQNEIDLQNEQNEQIEYDILLIADTHLQKAYNAAFVKKKAEEGEQLLVTGRIKPEQLPQKLLESGKAVRHLYPHHQSKGDMLDFIEKNSFAMVLPFHNDEKEILFCEKR